LCICAAIFTCASSGQESNARRHYKLKGDVIALPAHKLPPELDTENVRKLASVNPLPTWNYSILAYDGKTYTGTIIGRSPYNNGKATTTIPTQIIPLVIRITDSSGTAIRRITSPWGCPAIFSGPDVWHRRSKRGRK
jgi:hypothetical protein